MMFRMAKLTGAAITVGALTLGLVSTPAAATVSDEDTPLVMQLGTEHETLAYVVSADGGTAYGLGDNQGPSESTIVDLATRTLTGRSASIDLEFYRNEIAKTKIAMGPRFAIYGNHNEYALITLGTDDVQYFTDSQGSWPRLRHLVSDESGQVTAISEHGVFLSFNGSDYTEETRFRPEDTVPEGESGMSENGMLYFESYAGLDQPGRITTVVVDMRTGESLGTLESDIDNQFTPVTFDTSGTSLWGKYANDPQTLVNVDWQSGTPAFPSVKLLEILPLHSTMYADGAKRWFIVGTSPMFAGDFTNEASYGSRLPDGLAVNFFRSPATGDLLFHNLSTGQIGLVVAPKITTPVSVDVTALGQVVTFSTTAEGLAMSDPETEPSGHANTPHATFGSVWQSSPDGTTWTDIENSGSPQLILTATEESIGLQYRRHFYDRFWGEQNSAPAHMNASGPEITRADDLPPASSGKPYPAQTITATGQLGMTWSSDDLPAGLSISASTGELTGTAPQAGEYQFTVTVTDIFGTDSKLFHLKSTEASVVPPVAPKPKPEPNPTPAPNPSHLARTGASSLGSTAGVALALLTFGTVGLLSSRRRASRLQR